MPPTRLPHESVPGTGASQELASGSRGRKNRALDPSSSKEKRPLDRQSRRLRSRTHVAGGQQVLNTDPYRYVPETSLSSPPWPEIVLPDPAEETRQHAEVVGKVNELIATGQYGRLFAVVHFASHQWKVTSEDLILIDNELDVACGERIRLEKQLE
ncbi:39S ribosomal protein L21, mitochondrial-like [Puma concolor]|uniref:Large ribosomal subunit protein bL21m n=1 Tax=Puma concolor TaxID=9696 RepID=A0A6P6H657_PUMCO|nr:39S ribosomal protein L21, mitochondrial-like [Puma concolor]